MNNRVKAVYITKNKNNNDIWEAVSHDKESTVWFLYREFLDPYVDTPISLSKCIDTLIDTIEDRLPSCEIIFIEPSDDYIIKKFNEHLIDRLRSTHIKFEWIGPVGYVDFKQIIASKFPNKDEN